MYCSPLTQHCSFVVLNIQNNLGTNFIDILMVGLSVPPRLFFLTYLDLELIFGIFD